LFVAVAAEVVAFVLLMPRLYGRGPRAVAAGTLAIVGAHFILMMPAFGFAIGLLGALCVGNAAALARVERYQLGTAWLVDGTLKLLMGAAMMLQM
jgi:hypothetical protein